MESAPENQDPEEETIDTLKMEKLIESQENHNYIFRVCLLGDSSVGKTSLLTRFCDNSFKENYNNTIGVDFRVATLKYKDTIIKLHIWDTAGQERFKSITVNYFRSTHGFIFTYDITEQSSFDNISTWIDLANNNANSSVISFLVGNKSDLEGKRKVDKKKAEDFAREKNLIFFETSAKCNNNVEIMFEYCAYKLIQYFQKNKDKYNPEIDTNKLNNNFEEINIEKKNKSNCGC